MTQNSLILLFPNKILKFLFQYPPWSVLTMGKNDEVVEHTGLIFAFLNELAKRVNFTYKVKLENFLVLVLVMYFECHKRCNMWKYIFKGLQN